MQRTCSGEPGSGSPDATLSTDSEYAPAVRARKATARHPSAPMLTAVDTGPGPEPDAATAAVDRPSRTRLPNLSHGTSAQVARHRAILALAQPPDHCCCGAGKAGRSGPLLCAALVQDIDAGRS